jgi:hypothetical protein
MRQSSLASFSSATKVCQAKASPVRHGEENHGCCLPVGSRIDVTTRSVVRFSASYFAAISQWSAGLGYFVMPSDARRHADEKPRQDVKVVSAVRDERASSSYCGDPTALFETRQSCANVSHHKGLPVIGPVLDGGRRRSFSASTLAICREGLRQETADWSRRSSRGSL